VGNLQAAETSCWFCCWFVWLTIVQEHSWAKGGFDSENRFWNKKFLLIFSAFSTNRNSLRDACVLGPGTKVALLMDLSILRNSMLSSCVFGSCKTCFL